MAHPPQFPLLRFDPPRLGARKKGSPSYIASRLFSAADQTKRGPAQSMRRLQEAFAAGKGALELRSDPSGLAPERLLVFELTGDIQNFARAVAKVPGLEFLGVQDLEEDELDGDPILYLMIPNEAALRQLLSLWQKWLKGEPLPYGFAPWRELFKHLRDLRPWGPQDRLTDIDMSVIASELAGADGKLRLEIELVFRANGKPAEDDVRKILEERGGTLISRSRIEGAGYHALLVDVPLAEVERILAKANEGIIAAESVMHIRPQSIPNFTTFEALETEAADIAAKSEGEPIVAIFDAVPMSGHERIAEQLSIDDPFNLEPLATGVRVHGTAMASAVLNGDLSSPLNIALKRRVFFVNVMFASQEPFEGEKFPDRLPADLFHEAIIRMKGDGAVAPAVIVVNASVGDSNKPFAGHLSGWARVLDYLADRYGILFVVSAGNHFADLSTPGVTTISFEALSDNDKAKSLLKASGTVMSRRRVLAPAESINALTVGSLNFDSVPKSVLPASISDVWYDSEMCCLSSALGPGYGNSVKPDILMTGGRHFARLLPDGDGHALRPLTTNAGTFGGILVASPPTTTNPSSKLTGRTVGTSVAAALATGLAARVHEILEEVYDGFADLPGKQRAVLLKAMLVHCARWTKGAELIAEVLGPSDPKKNVRKKDNIRRYLGYGAVDDQIALDCATDRATLWAVGSLSKEQSHTFSIPLPKLMSGKKLSHEVSATVAWFSPTSFGSSKYKAVRLKLLNEDEAESEFAVRPDPGQPDFHQSHKGTVIHRRWTGDKAVALGENATFEFVVQRQPDSEDSAVAYAVLATVTMPTVAGIYEQVRNRIAVKPKVPVKA